MRNKSNVVYFFKQTFNDVENNYRDVAAYDINYFEFKDFCRKAFEKDFFFLCIAMERSKKLLCL